MSCVGADKEDRVEGRRDGDLRKPLYFRDHFSPGELLISVR